MPKPITQLDTKPPANPLLMGGNPLLGRSGGIATTHNGAGEDPRTFNSLRQRKRLLTNQLRTATAAEAIRELTLENEVFGLTAGQFSKIELITAILEKTGPAEITVSTWTAARADAMALLELKQSGKATKARFLFDYTFARRDPAAANHIRQTFGPDSIALSVIHAKFVLVRNEAWKAVLRTSMNLNMNPRTEDFTLANDPELFDFLNLFVEAVFSQPPIHDNASPSTHRGRYRCIRAEIGNESGGG